MLNVNEILYNIIISVSLNFEIYIFLGKANR